MTAGAPRYRGQLPPSVIRLVTWSVAVVAVAAAVTVALAVVVTLRVVTVPVLAALLGTALVGRPARRLADAGLRRGIAALLATAILLAVVGLSMWVLVTTLTGTWMDIRTAARQGAETVDGAISTAAGSRSGLSQDAVRGLDDLTAQGAQAVASGVVDGVSLVTQLVAGVLLTLTLVFHFLRDGPRLWSGVLSVVPTAAQDTITVVARRAMFALAGYVRGASLIALADAVLVLAGLLVLSVPHAPGLACIVFIGAFVPYVGTLLSGAVAVLVALADRGAGVAVLVVLLLVLVQAVDGTVLSPWMQSRTVRLHPVVVLLALTAGAQLGGVTGTLLAVPVAAVLSAVRTPGEVH